MQIQNAILTGSTTVYGPITFVSGTLAGSASYAATSSYADTFTVAGSLTAQTLVVQTITSSVSFITGSTRFGSLLTNTHTFTGSLQVTGSTISLSNSKVIIGDDGTYGGNISTIGFGGTSNGFNRIAAANNTSDGLYLIAATGRGIYLRTGGKSTQDLSVFPNGNTALGVNFLLPTATLHISGSGSGSLMQISSTVSSSIFFVSGSGAVLVGSTSPAGSERFGVTRDDGVTDGLHIIADFNRSLASSAELILGYYATASAVIGPVVYAANSQPLLFAAGSGEKMRLTTAGNLVVGGTTAGTSLNTSVTVNNSSAANYSGFIPMTADTQRGYYGGTNTGLEIGVAGTGILGVWTGGSERMRVTSVGNIGIGTSSPVTTDLTGSLTIVKKYQGDTPTSTTAQLYYTNQSALYLFGRNSGVSIISNNNEEGHIQFGNASTTRYARITTGTGASAVGGDMYFNVGSDTERMRITTAGRVGIGTTAPDTKLHLYDGTNPLSLKIQRTTVPVFFSDVQTAGTTAGAVWSHNIENTSNGSFTWSGLNNTSYAGSAIMLNSDTSTSYTTFHTANSVNTAPTERMRITGPGNLLVGQSTPDLGANGWQLQGVGGGHTAFQVTNNEAFIFNNRTTGTTFQIDFRTNGVERGSINVTDASTSYATTSDYRIKEDFKDFNGLEKLTNIKVYDFKFKELDERMDGVIAHELQEVLPYAVHGEKDGTKFQSVDYSKLVPVLVKSIQELSTKLEEATTRIKTLESK